MIGRLRLSPGIFLPGFFQRIPIDAVVLAKAVVLAGNHGAFELIRDLWVGNPLLAPTQAASLLPQTPDFRTLEGGGLRVHHPHGRNACDKEKLERQHGQRDQSKPTQNGFHRIKYFQIRSISARNSASTGCVGGRTPRQIKKASAACSTSMPRPSRAAALCSPAQVIKLWAAGPYIRS